MKSMMLRRLTVLITREDESCLRQMRQAADISVDEFISELIRRTYAEYRAMVQRAKAAQVEVILDHEITDTSPQPSPEEPNPNPSLKGRESEEIHA